MRRGGVAGSGAGYSLRDVQRMLGISRGVVERLVTAGFVTPVSGERRERRFSFQDVVILRTAHSLRTAGVAPRKILRALEHLKRSWVKEGSLTSLRIAAFGNNITVKDASSRNWDAETGQLLIDFEPEPVCGNGADSGAVTRTVAAFDEQTPARQRRAILEAVDLFRQAETLEDSDLDASEVTYRRALEQAPDYLNASLNLGCILAEAHRYKEAIAVYRAALVYQPNDAILHFNLGVVLEDDGRLREALVEYQACISLADEFADAHFNAARIHQELGDATKAIRHFNHYRKLQRE